MADSVEREIRELQSLLGSDRDPGSRAFVSLADAYRRLGDLDQALAVLEDGLGRHSDFAPGHVVEGWVHRSRGEPDLAQRAFHSALALDDENTEALRGLAEVAVERHEGPLAADFWRRLVELDPGDPDLRDRLAEADRMGTLQAADDDPWGEPDRVSSTDEVAHTTDEVVITTDDIVVEVGEPTEAEPGDVRIEPEPSEREPELGSLTAASAMTEPASSRAADADPWASPVRAVPEGDDDVPVTRTMADLYVRQNLHQRALRLYRQLLERAPDDASLAMRVREMEAIVAKSDASANTDVMPMPVEAPVPIETLAPSFDETAAEVPTMDAMAADAPVAAAPHAPEGRMVPRAARPARRPSDAEVEELARDWAEGPRDTSGLSTPFAWATRPAEPAAAVGGGRPIADYFSGLLKWEPGAEAASVVEPTPESGEPEAFGEPDAVAEPETFVWPDTLGEPEAFAEPAESFSTSEPPSFAAVTEAPSVTPEPDAAQPERAVVAIESLAPEGRPGLVVPIGSLAPDAPAVSEPTVVVPIGSLAPHIVDVASLAPSKSSGGDFSRWLERLK